MDGLRDGAASVAPLTIVRGVRIVGQIARQVPLLPARTPCAEVTERFAADPAVPAFVVQLGGGRFALVDRSVYLPQYLHRFNREVYGRQPVTQLAQTEPLVLPDDTAVEQAGTLITTHHPEALKSGFIITSRGAFAGIVLGIDLMSAIALCAEEANAAKSTFLANMSHEIRTPLHAVLGSLELLVDTPLQAGQAELLRVARVAAQSLTEIIGDLLDLSKLQADGFETERVDTELRSIVDDACAIATPAATQKGLRLQHRIAGSVPRRIVSDPLRIRQVLVNFIGNAVKFTREGGVFVAADRHVRDGQDWLRLEVSDTGTGFDPARAAALFEPFVQEDVSTTRRYGGTGLGLAISKRIVEMLGGNIGCGTVPGLGATFWCELPILVAEEPTPARANLAGLACAVAGADAAACGQVVALLMAQGAQASIVSPERGLSADQRLVVLVQPGEEVQALELLRRGVARGCEVFALGTMPIDPALRHRAWRLGCRQVLEWQHLTDLPQLLAGSEPQASIQPEVSRERVGANFAGRGLRPVLVIDDTATNRELAARQLARLGLDCETAENGLEGLNRATREDYSLILVDGSMPEMDGFDFARQLRLYEERQGLRRVPVISMTAHALSGDAERFLQAGMDGYLAKPVSLQRLEKILATWLGSGEVTETELIQPPEPRSVPCIDHAQLAGLLGTDDPQVLAEMLEIFVADLAPLLDTAREALSSGDRAVLRESAHAAKGAAMSAAAAPLTAILIQLEQLAEAGDPEVVSALVKDADAEFARVRHALRPGLSKAPN